MEDAAGRWLGWGGWPRATFDAFPVTEDGIAIGLVASPTSPMTEVLERMTDNETRRVPVAREWEHRGIITGGDVANGLDRAGLVP